MGGAPVKRALARTLAQRRCARMESFKTDPREVRDRNC